MALIIMFAAVAVPGPVGSWAFSPNRTPSAETLRVGGDGRVCPWAGVDGDPAVGPVRPLRGCTGPCEDPPRTRLRSAGRSGFGRRLPQPTSKPAVVRKARWRLDRQHLSGMDRASTGSGRVRRRDDARIGRRRPPVPAECTRGSRSRTPGTVRVVTARVVDRGPYVSGRPVGHDGRALPGAGHCYTGAIYWSSAAADRPDMTGG
jgi:hypothetical protein